MKSHRRPLHPLALALILFLLTAGTALASPIVYVAQLEYDFQEHVCLLIVPDGSGPDFTGARYFGGAVADATLRLQLMWADEWGWSDIASYFPASEIIILPEDFSHIDRCQSWGVTQADADTDLEGWTTISQAPQAGGWSNTPVMIEPYADPAPGRPEIYFNSPDINADGTVDLADVGLFAQDFLAGSGAFRSDFFWDGQLNLADLGLLAQHMGASCP